MKISPTIYLNGHLLPANQARISPVNNGFLFGEGLFETLRADRGKPARLCRHLKRLRRGLVFLGLPEPVELQNTAAICTSLLRENRLRETPSIIKIIASRDPQGPTNLLLTATPLDLNTIRQRLAGMRATIAPWRRDRHNPLLQIKSLNYLENRRALQDARAGGFDETIFRNHEEDLCEGSFSNLFLVRGHRLLTPPATSGLLPGIIRELLLEKAAQYNIEITETTLSLRDFTKCDGAFLTSSLMGIAPLTELSGQTFVPVQTHELRKKLGKLLDDNR